MPVDAERQQVVADTLLSSADPLDRVRGELIALAVKRTTSPWKPMLDRRTRELWAAHGAALLGPLHGFQKRTQVPHVAIDWQLGTVRRVFIQHQLFNEEDTRVGPIPEALALPVLANLEALEIRIGLSERFAGDHQRLVDALKACGLPLRTLTLSELGDPWGDPWAPESRVDLSGLVAAFPTLESLEIEGAETVPGDWSSPRLKRLALKGALRGEQIAALCASDLPALEELTLGYGSDDLGSVSRALKPLFAGTFAPRLVKLTLDGHADASALLPGLLGSPLLPRLKELGLVKLFDPRRLVAARDQLKHLDRLEVPKAIEALKATVRWVDAGETRLEKGDRFCEVELDEPKVFVREGVIGTAGKRRVRTDTLGWPEFYRVIEERRLDGYRRVGPVPFDRVGEVPNAKLFRALRTNPTAYLAFADWIRQWGAPRAELISLQCAPATDATRRRIAELLDENADVFLGPLKDHVAGVASPRVEITWRYGFIIGAHVEVLEGDPDPLSAADVVAMLLTQPLLESLDLVLRDDAARAPVDALLAAKPGIRLTVRQRPG